MGTHVAVGLIGPGDTELTAMVPHSAHLRAEPLSPA